MDIIWNLWDGETLADKEAVQENILYLSVALLDTLGGINWKTGISIMSGNGMAQIVIILVIFSMLYIIVKMFKTDSLDAQFIWYQNFATCSVLGMFEKQTGIYT